MASYNRTLREELKLKTSYNNNMYNFIKSLFELVFYEKNDFMSSFILNFISSTVLFHS